MNEEHTKYLVEHYPKLYRYATERGTTRMIPMIFGFMCEDGWFDLVNELSKIIEDENNMRDDPEDYIEAIQVKEKYGGLRFYITSAPEDIHNKIDEAEKKSRETCETCGKEGTLKELPYIYWYQTLCDEHYEQRKEELTRRFLEIRKEIKK